MTLAPQRRPLVFEDLDGVVAAIRLRGGRLTTARHVLLEALFAADRPVSAEDLAGRTSDLSSVYRNLELLEQLGVVRHLHLGHGAGLYVLERGEEQEYLACERCHRVDVVPAAALDGVRAQLLDAFGYDMRFAHFPLVGLCADCRER